jgi:endonuclease YncB( thermonuclease family)
MDFLLSNCYIDFIAVKINKIFQKIKVRCYGYDSPEMKPPLALENREHAIKKANEAKDYLSSLVLNKIVHLQVHGFDKYGRFLATVHIRHLCSSLNISEEMIRTGHGKEYYGGKKDTI